MRKKNGIIPFLKKINYCVSKDLNLEIHKQNIRDYYELKSFYDNEYGLNNSESREIKITVSLTTYGERIYDVCKTIQSLFNQSFKADRIILWLSKEEFDYQGIPLILKNMEKRGLQIKYCEDIKSYKKLIPTLSICPENIIITVDDDIIYPNDLIESLYKEYLKNSDKVIFNLGKKISFEKDGTLSPYDKWEKNGKFTEASFLLIGIGVGGILYPPFCFDKEILNKKIL